MDRMWLFVLPLWSILLGTLSLLLGFLWARRRALRELAEIRKQAAAERDAIEARIQTPLRVEIEALQQKLVTERQRLTQQSAILEASKEYEVARWRNVALGAANTTVAPPDYPDRPSLRELDLIVNRIRGLAFLDAVAIADHVGLMLSSTEGPETRALANLAPLAQRLQSDLPGAGETRELSLALTLDDGRHIALRTLPPWTRGAWLIAEASFQPPSPLALDAAMAMAMLRQQGPQRPTTTDRWAMRGFTDTYTDSSDNGRLLSTELIHCRERLSGQAVALCHEGVLICAAMMDGPSSKECTDLCRAFYALRNQVAWMQKTSDVLRIEVTLEEGLCLTYVPMEAGSKLAGLFVTTGAHAGAMIVSTFLGRIRRLLFSQSLPTVAPLRLVDGAHGSDNEIHA